jgi:1,4-alpha-glucan branching enzyme
MQFIYDTGLRRKVFHNVRLCGSWDTTGKHSTAWAEQPMREALGDDGAIVFEADVHLSPSDVGKEFHWRVVLDGPLGLDRQG